MITGIKPLYCYRADNGNIVRPPMMSITTDRFSSIHRFPAHHHSFDVSALGLDHGVMISGRGGLSQYMLIWDKDIPIEVRPYLTFYNEEGVLKHKKHSIIPLALFDVEFTGPDDIGLIWKLMI